MSEGFRNQAGRLTHHLPLGLVRHHCISYPLCICGFTKRSTQRAEPELEHSPLGSKTRRGLSPSGIRCIRWFLLESQHGKEHTTQGYRITRDFQVSSSKSPKSQGSFGETEQQVLYWHKNRSLMATNTCVWHCKYGLSSFFFFHPPFLLPQSFCLSFF